MNENILTGSVHNIVDTFERATEQAKFEGEDWYTEAQAICVEVAAENGCELEDSAGVMAILSPQLDWESNVDALHEFFREGRARQQSQINNDKAVKAAWGDHDAIRGVKVRAFWQAIVDPYGESDPVIDRHAVGVYCGYTVSDKDRKKLDRKDVVPRIQAAYREAARIVNEHVHTLQAVTWSQWRLENVNLAAVQNRKRV